MPVAQQAADAATVLDAFREIRKQLARSLAARSASVARGSLSLRGSGKIVALDKKGVGVALETRNEAKPDVRPADRACSSATPCAMPRDCSTRATFPTRSISTKSRRSSIGLSKRRVIPTLKEKAATGQHVRFAGCAEIPDEDAQIISR